tara:strand:+ start:546 stop:704 length:159 start_codon:yes stop_codon:yes gene_type:complete
VLDVENFEALVFSVEFNIVPAIIAITIAKMLPIQKDFIFIPSKEKMFLEKTF